MDMIRVSDVVGAIERYFEGGVARYLTSSQSTAAEEAFLRSAVHRPLEVHAPAPAPATSQHQVV